MKEKYKRQGMTGSPENKIWSWMISRCHNPRHEKFSYYGGRGISVCDKWRESFIAFFSDVGPRPSPHHTLERIDNDGNYEPGNVRWATKKEQARNRRSTIMVEFRGRTQSLPAWADELGVPKQFLDRRLRIGWPAERAFTEPARIGRWLHPEAHEILAERAER